jgi:hypothetical protein
VIARLRGAVLGVRVALVGALAGGLAAALAGGMVLSGCGSSSSGLANQPARQILQQSVKALTRSKSFYVTGDGANGLTKLSVALRLFSNGSFYGTLDDGGTRIEIVGVAGQIYIEAPVAFWEKGGLTSSFANQLNGKYAKLPASESGSLDEFTYAKVASQLSNQKGQVTDGGTKSVDGQQVIDVLLRNGTTTGHVYVAASGTPYPVELDDLGGGGAVELSQWNHGTAPKAPTDIVLLPSS